MKHVVNSEIKFQVCQWQHLHRICQFIIRVRNSTEKHSQTLANHWFKRGALHHQCCWILLNWVLQLQPWKYLAQSPKKWVCGALFNIRIPLKLSQRQHWAPILMATWNRAKSSGSLSLHWMRLLWLSISLRIGYRVCRSVWTQTSVRSITRCVTKLIRNYRHWDQSLHRYPPVISLQGPRSNPVFEYHRPPSPIWERMPRFLSCKRYWYNALVLTGALIRTLL